MLKKKNDYFLIGNSASPSWKKKKKKVKLAYICMNSETVFGSRFLQMSHVQKLKLILSISGTDVSPPYPKSRTRANSRVQRLWENTCSTCLDVVLTLLGRETGINGFGMYPTGNCIMLKLSWQLIYVVRMRDLSNPSLFLLIGKH